MQSALDDNDTGVDCNCVEGGVTEFSGERNYGVEGGEIALVVGDLAGDFLAGCGEIDSL